MMPEINPTKAITDLCEDAKCVLGVRISLAFPSLVGVIAHAKCVVLCCFAEQCKKIIM